MCFSCNMCAGSAPGPAGQVKVLDSDTHCTMCAQYTQQEHCMELQCCGGHKATGPTARPPYTFMLTPLTFMLGQIPSRYFSEAQLHSTTEDAPCPKSRQESRCHAMQRFAAAGVQCGVTHSTAAMYTQTGLLNAKDTPGAQFSRGGMTLHCTRVLCKG